MGKLEIVKYRCILLVLFLTQIIRAQNTFNCVVQDSLTGEGLIGVNVYITELNKGTATDLDGHAVLTNIPDGSFTIRLSYLGFKTIEMPFTFPQSDPTKAHSILMAAESEALDEVVVSSSRTNARIEELPVKVEVLGQEEMDEESTLVPGGIGSILGDLSIITVQRVNAVNGNDVIRMQGLDARYTQILRDGLPLYGGFSGSLGVLSIPPLDLKQVEIIKGSASTLYGGGAIGGLINFISKTPGKEPTTTMVLNGTTLGEGNVNLFTSATKNKLGYTFFTGGNLKPARDVNGDGFVEVPYDASFTMHPRFFVNLGKQTDLNIGFTGTYNRRKGGDLQAIQFQPTLRHPFLQTEEALRTLVDLQFHHTHNNQQWTVKTAGTRFDRTVTQPDFHFQGKQLNSFTEVNDLITWSGHSLVLGGNLTTESFQLGKSDEVQFDDYHFVVPGFFAQDDWQFTPKLSLETGLRWDHHNVYGNFVLPRLAFYYRPVQDISIRLAYGTGYKAPSLFDVAEPSPNLLPVPGALLPERSGGFNADANWSTLIGDALGITLNQALYLTNIRNANLLVTNPIDEAIHIVNSEGAVKSYGTDTYIQMDYHGLELYFGFNYTDAFRDDNGEKVNLAFNPKIKISDVIAYELGDTWRMGIESSFSGRQYIENNERVPNFWFWAAMVERKFNFGSLVLNCENVFDARQSNFGPLVTNTGGMPVYTSLWMPVEGRVVNLALRIKT